MNDFRRVRIALTRSGVPDRVPLWELHVDLDVKEAFLGRRIQSPGDEAEFWVRAGYDYVPVGVGLLQVGGVLGGQTVKGRYSAYHEQAEMTWAPEHLGPIQSFEDLAAFDWPDPEEMDLSPIPQMRQALPEKMGLLVVIGKVFTATWMLMGFEGFSRATVEQPELVAAVFGRVTAIQMRCCERAAQMPGVDGLWMSDDIAYATGLLVRPELLRRHVFPCYERIGRLVRERGLLYVYHSDGDLRLVLEDIIRCGFHGLHPIEPKAMDIRVLKRTAGDRLCLLGGLELDRLARGTPAEVRRLARGLIGDVGYDGGYCLGSSNSVARYVPLANYRVMLEAALQGRAPSATASRPSGPIQARGQCWGAAGPARTS